jgi:BlaI family penicillinase repressor
MANKQVEISMAEWDVMNIIWDKKSVSANEIVVEIQKYKEVSDKTIRTLITRLYKKEIIKRYKSENIYFYSSNIKEDDIKMKTAKTFLNKLYGGDMKSLVLNFAKNEELNNKKKIEELRDILNDISKKVIRDMFQTLYICKLYLTLIKLVLLITFKNILVKMRVYIK